MKYYKVLEVIWLHNYDFQQDYWGTFETLEQAQSFVKEHEKDWEQDLKEYAEVGVGVEIETWETSAKTIEEAEECATSECVDTYTEWCADK